MLFEKNKRLIIRPKVSVETKKLPKTMNISFTLENQNGKIGNIQVRDIEVYLEEMFADYDRFVILAPEKELNGISFLQACQFEEKINVQVGLKESGVSKLVEIYCSVGECRDIFMHFYNNGRIENLERYTPVQRM